MKNQGVSVFSVFGSFFISKSDLSTSAMGYAAITLLNATIVNHKITRLVSRRLWMMSDQGQPLTFASFSLAKSVLTMNTVNQGMTATDNEAQHIVHHSNHTQTFAGQLTAIIVLY